MTDQLIAYLGDPELKTELIAQLEAHKAADAIVQGIYSDFEGANAVDGFRGCAVGCTLHSLGWHEYSDHAAYEPLLGIPRALAKIQDAIFEGLPAEDARDWPLQFAAAIPVGADLLPVVDKFLLGILSSPTVGVLRFADDTTRPAIEAVIALYRRKIAGEAISIDEWRAAWSAASAAAEAAASAAAEAASRAASRAAEWAARAARAAAAEWAVAWAAEAAEWAVAWAAEAAEAWTAEAAKAEAEWIGMRDELLAMLRVSGAGESEAN